VRNATWFLAALFLLGAAAATRADVAKPPKPDKTPPKATVPVVILTDDKVTETHLEVPKSLLASLRADAGEPDGDSRRAGLAPLQLVVAGLALTVAISLGGLWLVRYRNRPGGRTLVVLLAVVTVLGAAGLVWANIAPPPPPPKPVLPDGILLSEKVSVDVVEKGDAVRLIVPRGDLAKVLDKAAPKKDGDK
jgi:hypothetical protein